MYNFPLTLVYTPSHLDFEVRATFSAVFLSAEPRFGSNPGQTDLLHQKPKAEGEHEDLDLATTTIVYLLVVGVQLNTASRILEVLQIQ